MNSKNNIFLPKKIMVGFQTRSDTYTQKLAYVIYYDEKGKLRKETSWQGWRDKKIEPEGYDNVPTEGFVLNKRVGGGSSSHYYYYDHVRDTKVRIYDPRGFEFEITVPNLLYILENATATKGKGLEGRFVYGWDGKDLVLIPEEAPEYKEMMDFTELQDLKVKKSDMVVGRQYYTKKKEVLTYLGFHFEYIVNRRWNRAANTYLEEKKNPKKHWYWDNKYNQLTTFSGLSNIAKAVSEETDPNLAEYYEKMESSARFSEVDYYEFESASPEDLELNSRRWTPLYLERGGRRFAIVLDFNSYWDGNEYKKDGTAKVYNLTEVDYHKIHKNVDTQGGVRYMYNKQAIMEVYAAAGLYPDKRYSETELLELGLQKHIAILKNGKKQK